MLRFGASYIRDLTVCSISLMTSVIVFEDRCPSPPTLRRTQHIMFFPILDDRWAIRIIPVTKYTWWCHQMETFSALLVFCAGNSPVPGEFPSQRPVTRSFDVCFDLRLNKRFCKQSGLRWFETPSRSLWRHCNVILKWRCFYLSIRQVCEHWRSDGTWVKPPL